MTHPSGAEFNSPSVEHLQVAFLEIMPTIEIHARIWSRHIACPGRRDDFVSEAISLSWRWFVRAAEQNKDLSEFASALASLAVKAVRSGRRLAGKERAKDVMSPLAQSARGFTVKRLASSVGTAHDLHYSDPHGQDTLDAFEERLHDNTQTPVIDQVIFRCDFREWMGTLPTRSREVAGELMAGERTLDVARKVKLSPGRVSQMRRELHDSWLIFTGEWGVGSCQEGPC